MQIEFISVRDRNNGYGVSKELFTKYFKEYGIDLIDKFDKERRDKADCSLIYSYPTNIIWAHSKPKVIFTMFETDKIPDAWIPCLKQADVVINPTKWGAEVFKKAGINCKVVNLGLNDEIFSYQERPERDIFTFLNYEAFTLRKGWHELWPAWQMAFREDEPVRMIFKTVAADLKMRILSLKEYKNVEVVNKGISQGELLQLLQNADCFVYPSRGEGFGIPPLEAMATGIPAIAPNAHGISEYFNPDFMVDLKYDYIPAQYDFIEGDLGNFVKCDPADIAKKLRFVYDNRKEYRAKSKSISEYALKYTMRRAAKELIKILEGLK